MGDTYLPIKFPWPGFLRGVHHPGPRLCGQTQGWDQIFCWPQGKRPQSNFIALLLAVLATLVILHLEKSILVIASSSDFSDWLHLYLSAIKVPKFSLVYIQLQSPGGGKTKSQKPSNNLLRIGELEADSSSIWVYYYQQMGYLTKTSKHEPGAS
jgi:hypothetical protein